MRVGESKEAIERRTGRIISCGVAQEGAPGAGFCSERKRKQSASQSLQILRGNEGKKGESKGKRKVEMKLNEGIQESCSKSEYRLRTEEGAYTQFAQ